MVWEGARVRCSWLHELLDGTCEQSGRRADASLRWLLEKEPGYLERNAWAVGGEAGAMADGLAAGALVVEIGLAVLSCRRALARLVLPFGASRRAPPLLLTQRKRISFVREMVVSTEG